MKRGLLAITILSLLFLIVAFAPVSQQIAKAYAPPPATNLFALLRTNLKIVLPPSSLMVPNLLRAAGTTYIFNEQTRQFVLEAGGDPGVQKLNVATTYIDDGLFSHYVITLTGFRQGEGGLAWLKDMFTANAQLNELYQPYGYKLTFKNLTRATATGYANALKGVGGGRTDGTFLSSRNCDTRPSVTGSTICTRLTASLFSPGALYEPHIFKYGIPVFGGILVEGNVVGSGTIDGFTFDPASSQAIAVGGRVSASVVGEGGTTVEDYVRSATKLQWSGVDGVGVKINKLITDNEAKAAVSAPTSSNIHLNSPLGISNPAAPTTLSSPPEGKLWKFEGPTTLNSAHVTGSGTVIINGSLTINGQLTCANNARLGLIVRGNININLNQSGKIDCGAFVATNGNINFSGAQMTDPSIVYRARGIFVASNNIVLPSITNDITMEIKYDHNFATNPTLLFKDLLSVTFGAISF